MNTEFNIPFTLKRNIRGDNVSLRKIIEIVLAVSACTFIGVLLFQLAIYAMSGDNVESNIGILGTDDNDNTLYIMMPDQRDDASDSKT
jgi:hypothetical protein